MLCAKPGARNAARAAAGGGRRQSGTGAWTRLLPSPASAHAGVEQGLHLTLHTASPQTLWSKRPTGAASWTGRRRAAQTRRQRARAGAPGPRRRCPGRARPRRSPPARRTCRRGSAAAPSRAASARCRRAAPAGPRAAASARGARGALTSGSACAMLRCTARRAERSRISARSPVSVTDVAAHRPHHKQNSALGLTAAKSLCAHLPPLRAISLQDNQWTAARCHRQVKRVGAAAGRAPHTCACWPARRRLRPPRAWSP